MKQIIFRKQFKKELKKFKQSNQKIDKLKLYYSAFKF